MKKAISKVFWIVCGLVLVWYVVCYFDILANQTAEVKHYLPFNVFVKPFI